MSDIFIKFLIIINTHNLLFLKYLPNVQENIGTSIVKGGSIYTKSINCTLSNFTQPTYN